jgi:hypothetical protein
LYKYQTKKLEKLKFEEISDSKIINKNEKFKEEEIEIVKNLEKT